jgi:hypothetical protein
VSLSPLLFGVAIFGAASRSALARLLPHDHLAVTLPEGHVSPHARRPRGPAEPLAATEEERAIGPAALSNGNDAAVSSGSHYFFE